MDEKSFSLGHSAAWRAILSEAIRQLGVEDPAVEHVRWISERKAAISVLREVCEDFGDNDWEDDLHLADVIDKHLGKHLHSPSE